jgi:hypothetical protein
MKESKPPRKRLLNPIDRISEVLFGLIMALTFTCSISAAEVGREDVRVMMLGAIGCNVAWGLVDAVVFLMVSLTERARGISLLRALRAEAARGGGLEIIRNALPEVVSAAMGRAELERLRDQLVESARIPDQPKLGRDDYLAAIGVFLLVFLSTFPVVIPFMLIEQPMPALRASNAVALTMLFAAGYLLGRYAQHRPVLTGLRMMLIGVFLVALTIALGG